MLGLSDLCARTGHCRDLFFDRAFKRSPFDNTYVERRVHGVPSVHSVCCV